MTWQHLAAILCQFSTCVTQCDAERAELVSPRVLVSWFVARSAKACRFAGVC